MLYRRCFTVARLESLNAAPIPVYPFFFQKRQNRNFIKLRKALKSPWFERFRALGWNKGTIRMRWAWVWLTLGKLLALYRCNVIHPRISNKKKWISAVRKLPFLQFRPVGGAGRRRNCMDFSFSPCLFSCTESAACFIRGKQIMKLANQSCGTLDTRKESA